ncbi:MAG: glycoside hydrolase family 2 [Acidobacteria bacterium]|nr:glycoside hydrolase family 2 [Acidobacteriota bacterium]
MRLLAFLLAAPLAAQTIPLEGTWQFRLDAEKSGLEMKWFSQRFQGDTIFLPGSTDQAGYGLKLSAPSRGWLSRPYTYEGPAWYQREINIPAAWQGKHVRLFLERPHWETRAWLDGRELGIQNSLSTPHLYDLGIQLAPGRHLVTLLIDNTIKIDVGRNAHSVTDHTQTNWNGVVGRIELQATPPVWIDRVRLTSAANLQSIEAQVTIRNATTESFTATLAPGTSTPTLNLPPGETKATVSISLPKAKPWDEYEGNLFDISIGLTAGPHRHQWSGQFGHRTIATRGTQFTLNGRPIFLRGTLECNIFPLSGYPPTDVESWRRLFRIARSYGLNHFRFHSWCPPEAAFQAADEAGFLLHVELPVWTTSVGKDKALTEFMAAEARRILDTYGNHPSFTMLCLGNELRGDFDAMDRLVADLKASDPRRLYTFSADHVRRRPGPTSDYYVAHNTQAGPVRIHGARFSKDNDGTTRDHSAHAALFQVPMVAHELGQWVTFPDYSEIGHYTGVLKPRNLEAFRAQLEDRGLLDLNRDFQLASGRFAWRLYKEDIETALRTPNWGGVQLLQLQDFPGQGEALIGLLDSFWESKGILPPQEMRGFFGPTTALARFPKFVYLNNETFTATLQLAHYGKSALTAATAEWSLTGGVRPIAAGSTKPAAIAPGQVVNLGQIQVPLAQVLEPQLLRLVVKVPAAETANFWDIWVYPAAQPADPAGVLITTTYDETAKQTLAQGGKVLLTLPAGKQTQSTMPMQFLPVFWSLTWFPKQPGHLGIFCDPSHPALAQFPTAPGSDFQWYDVTQNSAAFILDDTPAAFRPIVQVIDDYHRNHKLGAVLETKVGPGKLLLTSLDLATNLETRPAASQLRRSLLHYMSTRAFNPKDTLPERDLQKLLAP